MNLVEVVVKVRDEGAKQSLAVLGGAFKGFGAVAAGALGVGLSGPLAAAGLAMGAFAAVAMPSLDKVKKALTSTGTAGQKAWAALTPAQRDLAHDIQGLQKDFDGLTRSLTPVISKVADMAVKTGKDLLPALGSLAKAGATVIEGFLKPFDHLVQSPFFAQFVKTASQLATQIGPVLGTTLVAIAKALMQIVVQAGPSAVGMLKELLGGLVDVVSGLVPFIVWITKATASFDAWISKYPALKAAIIGIGLAIGIAVAAATGGWSVMAGLIAVAVGAIIHMWQTNKGFRDGVIRLWDDIKNAFLAAWHFIDNDVIKPIVAGWQWLWGKLAGFWKSYGAEIEQVWHAIWTAVTTVVKAAWAVIGPLVETDLKILWTAMKVAWDVIAAGVKIAWHVIEAIFKVTWDTIVGTFKVFLDIFTGHWSKAGRDLEQMTHQVWSAIRQMLAGIWGAIKGLAIQVFHAIVSVIVAIWDGLKGSLASIWNAIVGVAKAVWGGIYDVLVAPVKHAYDVIMGIVHAIENALGGIGSAINKALGGLPSKVLSFLGFAHGGVIGAATGGARSGLVQVGEHGRELVRLPAGSTVFSNPDTERMLSQGGGGVATVVFDFARGGGDSAFKRFMLTALRDWVRVEGGGDVQVALGRGY